MAMNTCRGAPAVPSVKKKASEETGEANDLVQIAAPGREEQIQSEDDQTRHQDGHVWEQRPVLSSKAVASMRVSRSSVRPAKLAGLAVRSIADAALNAAAGASCPRLPCLWNGKWSAEWPAPPAAFRRRHRDAQEDEHVSAHIIDADGRRPQSSGSRH